MNDLLQSIRNRAGRFPQVELRIRSIQIPGIGSAISLKNFLTYKFSSNMLVPVDSFQFTFVAPDDPLPFDSYFKGGDIAQLFANDKLMATGIIDRVIVDTDADFGEKVTVTGRDFLGQFEDQSAVNLNSTMVYGNRMTILQVFNYLKINTRMQKIELRNCPTGPSLFATDASESKLSALMRFMEPLNVIAWMAPDGTLIVGKPSMAQSPGIKRAVLNKSKRESNVLNMRATLSEATVANVVVPIWTEQVGVVKRVAPEQALRNAAAGPARLLSQGHFLPKTVVVSHPQGDSPSDLAAANQFIATPGGNNILNAYALRELARQNINERIVQAMMAGHLDGNGDPFLPDNTWNVEYDRAHIDAKMFCYSTEYQMSVEKGQTTELSFCNLACIVANIKAVT